MKKESDLFKKRSERAVLIASELHSIFKNDKGTALHYSTPWELLVAVVLSAQDRDVKINSITPKLFKKFSHVKAFSKASKDEVDALISSVNYHNTKAHNIINAAKKIMTDFDGRVPDDIERLITLPGVGRKSANVITSNAFNKVQGIAVDTHVRRFALKFDLTDETEPLKIERDLMLLLPQSEWFSFHNNLIYYGRTLCPAQRHDCSKHPLTLIYPEAEVRWPKAK